MVVVAAVISRNGRILVCQRSRGDSFALKWEFPGGKVKAGETPVVALARELQEELGVRATVKEEMFRTRHKYARMKDEIELIFYRTELASDAMENRVFDAMEWLEPTALRDKDFLDADRELVEKLARESEFPSRGGVGC